MPGQGPYCWQPPCLHPRRPPTEDVLLPRPTAKTPHTIALIGPPGSGKGSQAERLAARSGFATLATGQLLRDARAAGNELGRRAAQYMDRGDLVPDDVIEAVIRDAVGEYDGRPIVFDGFPRTVPQAHALEDALSAHARRLSAAVLVDIPDEIVVERISRRHQARGDDTPETVRERLRVYHDLTEPLVDHYARRGLLRRVDGTGDADAVEVSIRAALA